MFISAAHLFIFVYYAACMPIVRQSLLILHKFIEPSEILTNDRGEGVP